MLTSGLALSIIPALTLSLIYIIYRGPEPARSLGIHHEVEVHAASNIDTLESSKEVEDVLVAHVDKQNKKYGPGSLRGASLP